MFHSKRSRVRPLTTTWEKNSEWASIAARRTTTAAATQRPGWRIGTTGIAAGAVRSWVRPFATTPSA